MGVMVIIENDAFDSKYDYDVQSIHFEFQSGRSIVSQ